MWTPENIKELSVLIHDNAWAEDDRGYTHNPQRKLDLARDLYETAQAMEREKK